ncbi:MAG: hypothetical protein H5T62_10260 [Anaerolineae bacterium]|nr:hypothetical protein [Anaerolineae bacterium]
MEKIELQAEPRTIRGKKVKTLRRQGLVPGVLYGHRTEPILLQMKAPTHHPDRRWQQGYPYGPGP